MLLMMTATLIPISHEGNQYSQWRGSKLAHEFLVIIYAEYPSLLDSLDLDAIAENAG